MVINETTTIVDKAGIIGEERTANVSKRKAIKCSFQSQS